MSWRRHNKSYRPLSSPTLDFLLDHSGSNGCRGRMRTCPLTTANTRCRYEYEQTCQGRTSSRVCLVRVYHSILCSKQPSLSCTPSHTPSVTLTDACDPDDSPQVVPSTVPPTSTKSCSIRPRCDQGKDGYYFNIGFSHWLWQYSSIRGWGWQWHAHLHLSPITITTRVPALSPRPPF